MFACQHEFKRRRLRNSSCTLIVEHGCGAQLISPTHINATHFHDSAGLSPSLSSSSLGLGGFFPNRASYSAASSCSGWQIKHCDSGRSCSSHQSPLALKSATSLLLHWAHTSSGTPCSSHHHPSWLCPSLAASVAAGAVAFMPPVVLLQPANMTI